MEKPPTLSEKTLAWLRDNLTHSGVKIFAVMEKGRSTRVAQEPEPQEKPNGRD